MALPRRAGAMLLALALIAGLGPGALGDTKSDLAAAKQQLVEAEQAVAAQAAAMAGLQAHLSSLGTRIAAAAGTLRRTRALVARTRLDVAEARVDLGALRGQLGRRAAAMYMNGPGSVASLLLETTSLADLTDGFAFADSLARADADLVQKVQQDTVLLERQEARLTAVRTKQAATVRRLGTDRRRLSDTLAAQQAAVVRLTVERAQAAALVAGLKERLAQEERLAALAAIHGGTPVPFAQWAGLFLSRLGAPACHDNMVLVVAWESIEFTMARFNPLSTTYRMPGATDFNWAGVKNFISLDQGLRATVATLNLPYPTYGYGEIVKDLRACAAPAITAQAINRSRYCDCRGHYPLVGLIPIVAANYGTYAKLCTGC